MQWHYCFRINKNIFLDIMHDFIYDTFGNVLFFIFSVIIYMFDAIMMYIFEIFIFVAARKIQTRRPWTSVRTVYNPVVLMGVNGCVTGFYGLYCSLVCACPLGVPCQQTSGSCINQRGNFTPTAAPDVTVITPSSTL